MWNRNVTFNVSLRWHADDRHANDRNATRYARNYDAWYAHDGWHARNDDAPSTWWHARNDAWYAHDGWDAGIDDAWYAWFDDASWNGWNARGYAPTGYAWLYDARRYAPSRNGTRTWYAWLDDASTWWNARRTSR